MAASEWSFTKGRAHPSPAAFPRGFDQHARFQFIHFFKVGFLYGLQVFPNRPDSRIKSAQFVRVEPPTVTDMLGNVGAFLTKPSDGFAICLHAEAYGVAGADVADVDFRLHVAIPSGIGERDLCLCIILVGVRNGFLCS